MKSKWETMSETIEGSTERMAVPDGWIVKTTEVYDGIAIANSMVFIRDPGHFWNTEDCK